MRVCLESGRMAERFLVTAQCDAQRSRMGNKTERNVGSYDTPSRDCFDYSAVRGTQ